LSNSELLKEGSMDSSKKLIKDVEIDEDALIFSVCKKHKPLYSDYEFAHISDREHCILCNPVRNDSLGG
jgi:hypothetical protein